MVDHFLTSGNSWVLLVRTLTHIRAHIRAITIDLDDTLWPIGPVIARAERRLQEWLAANYPRVPQAFSRDRVMALRETIIAEHENRSHDLTFLRREVLRRMGQAAGYSIDVDAAYAVFFAARNEVELFPDVRPALESLARRYTVVAVTNGNADLGKIGIDGFFDGIVSARSAGAAKPARRIFAAAVAAGGSSPRETLHVGDHPQLDVDAARAAGLRAVWVNRANVAWPEGLTEPDGEVRDLHQLERLLRRG